MQTKTNHMVDAVHPEKVLKSLTTVHDLTERLVSSTEVTQLPEPTPCDDWNVRTLINHLCHINLRYAAMTTGRDFDDAPDTDYVGGDHVAAFRRSAKQSRDAFTRYGTLERTYASPWGEIPGAVLVQHAVNEHIAHAWDLAKATGRSTDILPEVARESLGIWRAWFDGDVGRIEGMFGPERPAPPGATQADRVAAYLGREA